MHRPTKPIRPQRGQVAIIVAVVIGLLILVVGLVVDLGYLYTRKTELQNAADAAALAGAKQLNGTADGIQAALDAAKDMAALNSVNFGGTPVAIEYQNIGFSSKPDDCTPFPSTSNSSCWIGLDAKEGTNPGKSFFVTVDTSGIALSTVQTWFMRVTQWEFGGIETTSTFGRAVAGPYVVDITPIAACALDQNDCPSTTNPDGTCGYERGKSYKIGDINPIGPGTVYWINPVTTDAGECQGTGSTQATLPFVCKGEIAANVALALSLNKKILTNTGVSTPQLEALDSRFDSYGPQAKCDPTTAPPDENIMEYLYTDDSVKAWNEPPTLTQQASTADRSALPLITTDDKGVFWTFVKPPGDITSRTANQAGYPSNLADPNDLVTPYTSRNSTWYTPPTSGRTPSPERRVLNLLIVNCPAPGGNCRETDVFATGQFLMQRKANVPGDKDIYVEFGGIIQRPPDVEIKLYR